jgi:catechol 2,3-dioxygenase-like lactoylglutathione lyase family enzyme
MARIRHIALATRDPEATKRFYIEGLGLKEVGKVNTPTSEGYYLSDGQQTLWYKILNPTYTQKSGRQEFFQGQ